MEILSSMPRLKRQNAMRSTGEKEKKKNLEELGSAFVCTRHMYEHVVVSTRRVDLPKKDADKFVSVSICYGLL